MHNYYTFLNFKNDFLNKLFDYIFVMRFELIEMLPLVMPIPSFCGNFTLNIMKRCKIFP